MTRWIVATLLLFATPALAQDEHRGLTAVEGLKVGHHTLAEKPTGCTVVLTGKDGAIAAVDVRGGAPATKETDLLDPTRHVEKVHAIVLTGGSAYGLDTATGVMRYLEERGIGYGVGGGTVVPIVPAASLLDLATAGKYSVRPGPECGYSAASAASDGPVPEGNVGAGAGATVGKFAGRGRAMKAGLGSASITTPDGLVVAAMVAVNAAGDIIDPATGQVVAGVRTEDGSALADARKLIRAAPRPRRRPTGARENTTIGIVATNAALSQLEALKVAQMAHDGFARAIDPVHTPGDGDTIFAVATARWGDAQSGQQRWRLVTRVGALAAQAMADAIVRAATQAESLPGLPAARDLGKDPGAQ